MENLKIFKTRSAKVEIDKIKDNGGSLLGFFTKKGKKEVIDCILYKSEAIFALSDSFLIIYDIVRETQTLEINELNKYSLNVLQIGILHQIPNYFNKEMLLCLCEDNIVLLDLENYLIKVNIELKTTAQKFYLEYTKDSYKILILHKYNVSVYEIKVVKNLIKLNKIGGFDTTELLHNKSVVYTNNLLIFETRNRINIYKFDYNSNSHLKSFIVLKKDISIYKNDILIGDTTNSKFNEVSRDILFNYSKITDIIYLTIVNKIFLVKNSFSQIFSEEFEILEKITKQNFISFTKIEDPYMFIFIDSKVYVYFILDLNKCIEIIDLNSSSLNLNILFSKNLNFLHRLNKINLETNLIQYTDSIHMNSLKYQSQTNEEFLLNSAQMMLMFYNNKNLKLEWIYSTNLQDQSRFLKSINLNFSSKLLSYYTQENLKLFPCEVKNINEKYFLNKNLELFYFMISSQEYMKAKFCQEETQIECVYLVMLLKNFLPSKNLILFVHFLYMSKYSKYYDSDSLSSLVKEVDELNNLISIAQIKNEKELALFLKAFFNKFISSRNEIKIRLDKEKRKKINFDYISERMQEGMELCDESSSSNEEEYNLIKKNYLKIKEVFCVNDITDDELQYALIENVVFIFHFYSFRLSKSSKYTDNLKLMIKISHNILDKDLILMLKQQNLEEEILLFYYYKGNYAKCVSNIVSIYESLSLKGEEYVVSHLSGEDFKELKDFKELTGGDHIISEKEKESEDLQHNHLSSQKNEPTKSLEKIKTQWLSRYINLISVIGEKLSQLEFYEYIKWALSKNSFQTIDILFENNKISKEKLDLEFINLLKIYGIDPVIFYLKKFLKNNEACNTLHHNEMINLYTIKLKLLQEAMEKESIGNKEFYKWNKKILSKLHLNL